MYSLMVTTNKKPKIPGSLDKVALEQMVEPLTVQIYKQKNGNPSPVPLPIGESGQPGVGWSKGEVLAIEQGWLVNNWSGGGMYEITVTDDTRPMPQKLVWKPYWPTSDYPDKIPPTLQEAARPDLLSGPASQPQPVQVPMTQFPGGLPSGGIVPYAPMQQHQPSPMYYPPNYQAGYQAPPSFYAQQQQQADQRRLEERLIAAEQQVMQSKLEATQRQYQIDLERERAANAAAIQRLESRLAEMTQAQTTTRPNAELDLLKQQLENERREREMERRERETRDMMTAQAANIQRQIEQMQQQHQTLMQAQQNRGPDPMLQMMAEQNRQQMDAMKEISRQSTAQIEKFQGFMMSPRDVMAMTKDASNGLDAVTQKMAGVYGNVLDMHQKVLENAMQLNQGGSETVGLIRDGVTSAKELAERYFTVKSKEAQAQAQAQAVTAQANAQVQAVQAQAQAAIAQAQSRAGQPMPNAPVHQPRPAAPSAPAAGLAGQPQANGVTSFDEWRKKREQDAPLPQARETVGVTSQPTPTTAPAPTIVAAPPADAKHNGHSDQEWFGPLYGDVVQLRIGVEQHLKGLQKMPPTKTGVDAETVSKAIFQAAGVVIQNNIPIPAMVELLNNQDYNKFLAVLLPNTPEAFRNDVMGHLKKLLGDETEETDDEDDLDADDDGEHSDDVRDGAAG